MTATTAGAAASRAGCIWRPRSASMRRAVKSERLALPATRFAVGAYLSFCTNRTLLEAVASSLTELFSPVIIGERVPAMLAKYDYVTEDTLAYFKKRPEQASRDSDFALAYVLEHADTPERSRRRSTRWSSNAISSGPCSTRSNTPMAKADNIPPGAFRPEEAHDRAARTGDGFAAVDAVAAEACAHPVRSGARRPMPCCRRKGCSGRTRSASTSCAAATAARASHGSSRDLAADYDAPRTTWPPMSPPSCRNGPTSCW